MFCSRTNFEILSLVFLLLSIFALPGRAASAACAGGWEWADNSLGQNPCQVAGDLQVPCLGYLTYDLAPLKPGSVYTEPGKNDTNGLKCDCNTIIYNLYSACEACQNASVKPWDQWSQNCDAVYVAQYPFDIPGDTAVPRWAFIDPTESGSFSVSTAQNVGRDPEAVGKVPVTLSLSSSSSTGRPSTLLASGHPSSATSSSYSSSLPTSGSGLNGATANSNNVPAIVGGVIGGVVFLACLSFLLFWLYLRRRSGGALPHIPIRPFSHRTFSTRTRGSYYPPSAPAYIHEPEMDKIDWQIPEISSLPIRPPPESTYSPTEFDVRTTYNHPLRTSGKGRNGPLPF